MSVVAPASVEATLPPRSDAPTSASSGEFVLETGGWRREPGDPIPPSSRCSPVKLSLDPTAGNRQGWVVVVQEGCQWPDWLGGQLSGAAWSAVLVHGNHQSLAELTERVRRHTTSLGPVDRIAAVVIFPSAPAVGPGPVDHETGLGEAVMRGLRGARTAWVMMASAGSATVAPWRPAKAASSRGRDPFSPQTADCA